MERPAERPVERPAPRPRQSSTDRTRTPEMRELCRQARAIDAPMGAAELCRGMYGR
ncbi:hypothetical protein [Streptomyces stackebrandtii]|uniref:hypothetical protein n=1 Tax=Streptomyces stackebrandtii TaxID=3051177 RepID=UPI0028DB8FF5|nr:hypothetical protein [Streptomyces sp. DSM 40976]